MKTRRAEQRAVLLCALAWGMASLSAARVAAAGEVPATALASAPAFSPPLAPAETPEAVSRAAAPLSDIPEDEPPSFWQKLRDVPAAWLRKARGVISPEEALVAPSHVAVPPPLYPYRVRFAGLPDDDDLKQDLTAAGALAAGQGKISVPPRLLLKRAHEELPALLEALRAEGYYGAVIDAKVTEAKTPGGASLLIYEVKPGLRYRIISERAELLPPDGNVTLPDPARLSASATGKPARSETLMAAAAALREATAEQNGLLSAEAVAALELDPARSAARAVYEVHAGPKARFGAVSIEGETKVRPQVIRAMLPWKDGQRYSPAALRKGRENLTKSGLFAMAEVVTEGEPGAEGRVTLRVRVKDGFHRTVKAGASYMTDAGPGAAVSWEHRNFFGGGETVKLKGEASGLKTAAEGGYTAPYFRGTHNALKLNAALVRETPEAYTSQSVDAGASVERAFSERLRAGAGGAFRLSHVENPSQGNEDYALLYWPVYAAYDSRDNAADPQQGAYLRADLAPYTDTLQSGKGFLRWTAGGSVYLPLAPIWAGKRPPAVPGAEPSAPNFFDRAAPLLAMRGMLGSVAGASAGDIPADTRLYAGGGASVRGYGYRELSPLKDGEPIGGKSLLELSAELRFRFTEDLGGAVFVEGGDAFEEEYPDFSRGLHWGAGAGARYFTPAGPLRFDVAVPLNRRTQDSAYALYVSLGQAF